MSDAPDLPVGPRAGDRETTFFDDPVKDHLLRSLVTVTMELSVTRDRLASLEALLKESGVVSADALDTLQPDMETARLREAARSKLIEDVLGPLMRRLAKEG
ncbi:hypothetical protein [Altererythrobacter lutimaris]|uniref:Uncharacterized protein n=1 Tax=Altererythrobacter lutimaris TaxID=2743979 RepID=A0A850H7E3_9SPHN|nr:hypothetical protein [Altererythrobacter lutimaris]NVE93470.1 hypothetical protein [Altererythrobacter lutimaris]